MTKLFLFCLVSLFVNFNVSAGWAVEPAKTNAAPTPIQQQPQERRLKEQKPQEAVEPDATAAATEPDSAVAPVNIQLDSRTRRAASDYFVLGNYSPIDLLISNKYGFTLGLINSADKSWEFEFLRGTIAVPFVIDDLGKMTDTRYSLIRRSYVGTSSFNFSYGVSYFDFSIALGDKLLSSLSGGVYPYANVVEVQSLGFNVGLGNRWVFAHDITFGVDWISWAQPLWMTGKKSTFLDYSTSQSDRDSVDKAMKLIAYFPRLAILKLQVGILF